MSDASMQHKSYKLMYHQSQKNNSNIHLLDRLSVSIHFVNIL